MIGKRERRAMAARMRIDCNERCPVVVVSSQSTVPARMKKKEGGATPIAQNNRDYALPLASIGYIHTKDYYSREYLC